MSVEKIGRVLFEGANGEARFTAYVDLPTRLRTLELFTEEGVFYAHQQAANGQWTYRYSRPLGGRNADPYVKDYKYPHEAETWDGPLPPQPIAQWSDLIFRIETLIHEAAEGDGKIAGVKLVELARLALAVRDKNIYQPLLTADDGDDEITLPMDTDDESDEPTLPAGAGRFVG